MPCRSKACRCSHCSSNYSDLYQQSSEEIARREAKPNVSIEGIVARIDYEVDEIRNGNVESGVHVADLTGLVAHFPEFYRVVRCLKITRQPSL